MSGATIEQVRSFNRTVTQRIGVLQDEYLARGRPLGASRVLWEVGRAPVDVRAPAGPARPRLGLPQPAAALARGRRPRRRRAGRGRPPRADGAPDRRRPRGARRARPRERRARRVAPRAARRRASASGSSRRWRSSSGSSPRASSRSRSRTRAATAARFCLDAYAAELDATFEGGFDTARSRPVDPAALTPPRGLLLVARLHAEPIACGALKLPPGEPAEIKRLWVAPGARRLGVARRVLAELEAQARQAGAEVVRLDTNRALRAATTLYRSAGYTEVPAVQRRAVRAPLVREAAARLQLRAMIWA